MSELKEQLDGMGASISDSSFAAMIWKSLPPSYCPLLQTLSASAWVNGKTLTCDQIISAVHEEADELKVHKDKAAENAALATAHAKKANGQKKKCANCKHTGHSKEDCFWKGGKEGQAPWDKKKDGNAKANTATAEDDVSLAVTCNPDKPLEALTSLPAAQNAIIDCGTTQHFTPNCANLTNFTEIPPKPIKAANGHTLQATRCGDLKILLPMGKDQPTKATLQNVYYSPDFAFTLISVGTMDKKGYQINFDNGICTIWMPKPNRHTGEWVMSTTRTYERWSKRKPSSVLI